MKILKITFQNLNSLQGEHSIDLENGLLGEAGIFSITGPTGAGKSTILDAITLALFGKAARYEKESNPGEMMTRGTGECAAEVLFECSQGRYTAKWTRTRSRKNPDGKLQNPKREIAKASTGEIIAEKLRDADLMVESLTGLDYHRFLRSVLLAQGRFKEFLDAGDNERGDLLEKITGTEIYSRISQKAYQTEREHADAIQAAQQKLGGVELKTAEQLNELQQEQTTKEAEVGTLKETINQLQVQLQRFDNHRRLTQTLEQSNQDRLKWQAAEHAFGPSRQQLEQHAATQPFQAELIQLDSQRRRYSTSLAEVDALTQSSNTAQTQAGAQLTATTRQLRTALQAQSIEIESTQARRLQLEADGQTIARWLLAHQADLTIESQLPEIRTLGESARLAGTQLARLQSEQITLNSDRLKNENTWDEKKQSVARSQQALVQAQQLAAQAEAAFNQAAEGQSIDEWRQRVTEQTQADAAAQALASQRTHWAKAQATLATRRQQRPALREQLQLASQTRDTQKAAVLQASAKLEDKQKIYQQAQLIATLEDHRLKLQPNQACPLCGSPEHPYAQHLESNQDANKQALKAQQQVLRSAEGTLQQAAATFTRLEANLHSLELNISQATSECDELTATVNAHANAAAYTESLANDAAFTRWQNARQQQRSTSEAKLAQLEQLERAQRNSQDRCKELNAAHQLSSTQLAAFEQKQAELTAKQQSLELEHCQAQQAIKTQLAHFNQTLAHRLPPAQTPAETQSRTNALEQQLRHYQAQIEAQAKLHNQGQTLATTLKELQQAQQRLTEERQLWQTELAPFTPLLATDHPAPPNIPATESQRRSHCQAALNAAQQSLQALQQKRTDVAQLAEQIQTATQALQTALKLSTFDSIDALQAARLSDSQLKQLKQQKTALQTEHDQLDGRITQIKQDLIPLAAAGVLTPDAIAALKTEHASQDAQIASHNKRLGEITLLLQQDTQARTTHAKLITQIETLAVQARPWIELNALIGSASGDKFSKFAQGLTLAQLLQLANRHLLQLNDRYHIQRTPESELSLQIVDLYQADAIRPTRSLSGGESFLVSLALALGLSDLAGSDTRIESLFIDEGFGTLDSDTLDIALAALENLRMSNRTIGIISHVDALKHRISAQIRVTKSSNGHGTLEIINGH